MAKKVIKGLDRVLKRLKRFGEEGEKVVMQTTEEVARDIMLEARIKAPKDFGKLAQSINYHPTDKGLNYIINVTESYAPYQEFGTGAFVDLSYLIEAGLPSSIAMKFKGKGLKQVNLQPQPFLYPAFIKGRKDYLKFLKQDINKLIDKYER